MEKVTANTKKFVVTATNKSGVTVWGVSSAESIRFETKPYWEGTVLGTSLLDANDAVRCLELARIDDYTDVAPRHVSIGDPLTTEEIRALHREKLIRDKRLTKADMELLVP